MSEVVSAQADLSARWLPSSGQTAAAQAVLSGLPGGCRAFVPLAQPGKQFGFWETGQQVAHPEGVWVGDPGVPDGEEGSWVWARGCALDAAEAWLVETGMSGTVAWAEIDAAGDAVVFEWPRP